MKTLLVDDDPVIREGYQRSLGLKLKLDTASNAEQALELCHSAGPYSVIVADMQMPGQNGLQFLQRIKVSYPDTVRVMLTGQSSLQVAMEAVNSGQVFKFLTKPCSPPSLEQTIREALEQWSSRHSQSAVLEKTLQGSIQILHDIIPTLGPEVLAWSQKLAAYAKLFAKPLGIPQEWELETSAMVSQIGLVHVPASLVQRLVHKQGLSGQDKDALARVPEKGHALIARIPQLDRIALNVLYQNKNYDGTGIPLGPPAGEDIPICSRVIRVVSDLLKWEDSGLPKARALKQMETQTRCYDPKVLAAAWTCFGMTPSDTLEQRPVKIVKARELQVGHVLASDLETQDGVLMMPAGTKISYPLLRRINNCLELGPMKEPILISTEP